MVLGWLAAWVRSPCSSARRCRVCRTCAHCYAWPAVAASGLAMAWLPLASPCRAVVTRRATTKPLSVLSPRRCICTLLPRRIANPPPAATLTLSSHHRCFRACPLHLYAAASLVRCHLCCHGAPPPHGSATRGQPSSVIFRPNCHLGLVHGSLLMLTR